MLISFFEYIHENSQDWDSESILKARGYSLNVKYVIYS